MLQGINLSMVWPYGITGAWGIHLANLEEAAIGGDGWRRWGSLVQT
jgi:hypothetical protein